MKGWGNAQYFFKKATCIRKVHLFSQNGTLGEARQGKEGRVEIIETRYSNDITLETKRVPDKSQVLICSKIKFTIYLGSS